MHAKQELQNFNVSLFLKMYKINDENEDEEMNILQIEQNILEVFISH